MKDSRPRRAGPAARDRGFALIAFLLLVVLVSAYVIADQLTRTNSELAKFREDRTMIALRQAKAALIAYAASEQWQLACSSPPCRFQPGALPCPDRNNDGASDGICPNALLRTGRLPWKTIGSDDLRDSSGEQLWYAVSANYVKNWGTTVINSDTQGQLTITGAAPASNVVAVVFAPGGITLQTQSRDPTDVTALNLPANYLENLTPPASPDYVTFFSAPLPSSTFNDRLLVITQADLMAAVEPVVTAKLQSRQTTDIWKYLDNYLATWGRYPYAVPFNNPGTADYKGAPGTYAGLLPLTAEPNFITWSGPSSPDVDEDSGDIHGSSNCTLSGSQIQCHIDYDGASVARITATANNVGRTLARAYTVADLNVTSPFGFNFSSLSVNSSLQTNAQATITFRLGLPSGPSSVDFTIPPPSLTGDLLNLANNVPTSNAFWFLSNEWYKSVFYAVAPNWTPGGSGNCLPNSCLTVNNLPAPNNDKRALLVLAGRALTGAIRPTGNLADYFEAPSLNLAAFIAATSPPTPSAPWVFEHRVGGPQATNDRVAVVAP